MQKPSHRIALLRAIDPSQNEEARWTDQTNLKREPISCEGVISTRVRLFKERETESEN